MVFLEYALFYPKKNQASDYAEQNNNKIMGGGGGGDFLVGELVLSEDRKN